MFAFAPEHITRGHISRAAARVADDAVRRLARERFLGLGVLLGVRWGRDDAQGGESGGVH
jgi:hypothetical protein